MKRKKNSRKVCKNKLFIKQTSKTYKRSRRGGVIDLGKPHTSPQKQVTPSSASTSFRSPKKGSFKSSPPLHSSPKKGSFKSSPPLHSPLKKLTSLKTLVEKKNTPDLPKRDSELYSSIPSISHVQEQQPAPPLPPNIPNFVPGALVQSYHVSPTSSPKLSEYNPPKNLFIRKPDLIPMEMPGSYPPAMINLEEYDIRTPPEPSPPQPLMVKTGSPALDLLPYEKQMIRAFNFFNQGYSNLAPKLYDIMGRINLENLLGNALIWGDLNDGLIECIGLSSEQAIESRLLYNNRPHIKTFIEKCRLFYINLGRSVSEHYRPKPYEYDLVTDPPPLQNADPQSYRVIGYNRHPFFNPRFITDDMYVKGMKNHTKKSNEYVYIQAHGGIGEELSPRKKILAKKYIRLLEFGSAFEMVAANYRPFFKKINDLMRQPNYHILFESTTRGEQMRKNVYSELCKYFIVGNINACSTRDSLTLVDITHERLFEGHFPDEDIVDNHKVTFRSMDKFKSMGIFVPVDYNDDKSEKFLYKKEMFKLYPGSNFFTKSTKVRLVDILLPIAINGNKIFNVIVFSCAVRYQDEPVTPIPLYPPPIGTPQHPIQPPPLLPGMPPHPGRVLQRKSSHIQRHMIALLKGKRYISDLLKFITNLEIESVDAAPYVGVQDLYNDNSGRTMRVASEMSEHDKDKMITCLEKLEKYHILKDSFFKNYSLQIIARLFSLNDGTFTHHGTPYYLIDPQVNPDINSEENHNLTMVKIYLMKDFYDTCYKKVLYIKRVFNKLHSILSHLRQYIVNNPKYTQVYDDNYLILTLFNDYLNRVFIILDFCNKGLQKTGPDSFYNYPKFVEMVEEYKKKRLNKFYDEIFPKMDFDQYNYVMKSLPTGWIENIDDTTERVFYVDTINKISYWNRPLIPPGWMEYIDADTGKPYYINDATGARTDILPGVDTAYPAAMYFSDRTKVANPVPYFRKQRQYIYKYDERDNIDKVKARIQTHKRDSDIKAHLLSSARKREETIKNRKARDYESKAELKKNPTIKDIFLEKAAEIRGDVQNKKYHVSV